MTRATPTLTAAATLPPWARGPLLRGLRRHLLRAGRRLGLAPSELTGIAIHVVDGPTIARLNLKHLGKRGTTDVLSFPSPLGAGDPTCDPTCDPACPPSCLGLLGDIVLGWPALVAQAGARDPEALLREATVLMIHGLAHLLGHDHRAHREGRAMHQTELRALAAAGIPDIPRPYGLRPTRQRR